MLSRYVWVDRAVVTVAFTVVLLAAAGPAQAQVASISLESTLDVASLNWPDGQWAMRAQLFDPSGAAVGGLTPSLAFTLNSQWPSIGVQMTATAADGSVIRFYRLQGASSIPDVNAAGVQFYAQECPIGDICDAATVNNLALSNTLSWTLFWDGFESGSPAKWSSTTP